MHQVPRTLRALFVALSVFGASWTSVAASEPLRVFAAASLGDVLDDLAAQWETDTGQSVTPVLAGSSVLARQIVQGAPADVYISANPDWMDWLEDQGGVVENTRRDVASNRLVLIAPTAGKHQTPVGQELTSDWDFSEQLNDDGRLAIALTEAVPAGIYAKSALENLGLWSQVESRLAETDNVRAALALVALSEAPLGLVYATDAIAEPKVHVVATIPEASHPPIRYPAAVVADTRQPAVAREFLLWLAKTDAQGIFAKHGFLPGSLSP